MPPSLRAIVTAFGLTELYTLLLVAPLIHTRHMALYHWIGPTATLFLPTFLDIALLWSAFTLLLHAARNPGPLRTMLWAILFVLTPPVVVAQAALLWRSDTAQPALIYLAAAAAPLLACLLFRASWQTAIHIASTVLLFFGLGGSILFAQLTWVAWQARALDRPTPLHQAAARLPNKPRILWIVFDELSYQQVFERRFPGLELPAFDALAAQSTLFTQTVPAGRFTDHVLPTLLSGDSINAVRTSPSGRLLLHHADTGQWIPLDPQQTVFEDALTAGYGTAIAGWYLPYCRLLPTVLDRCLSSYRIGVKSGLSPSASLPVNMARPFTVIAASILPGLAVHLGPGGHLADYQTLTQAATQLLDDPSATFILLHLPIPHLGGIYNRATGQFTTGPATYLDNLALTDQCLAELRAHLEQSGQWDDTTVLLMGDHGWRTAPTGNPVWANEEQQATHGGIFDPRPAYILKLARQHTPATISQPFPALATRSLVDALLRDQIRSPQALSAWAAQRRP